MKLTILLLSLGLLSQVECIMTRTKSNEIEDDDDALATEIEESLYDDIPGGDVPVNGTVNLADKPEDRNFVDRRFPFHATIKHGSRKFHYVSQASRYKKVVWNIKVYEVALYADRNCSLWKSNPINVQTLEEGFPGHGFIKVHIVSKFVNGKRMIAQMKKTLLPRLRALGVTNKREQNRLLKLFGKRVEESPAHRGDDVDMYMGTDTMTTYINDKDKGTEKVGSVIPRAAMRIYFDDNAVTPRWLKYVRRNFGGGVSFARRQLENYNKQYLAERRRNQEKNKKGKQQ